MSREELMKLIYTTNAYYETRCILQLQFVVKNIDDDLLLLSNISILKYYTYNNNTLKV